jgi:hypothetical protein
VPSTARRRRADERGARFEALRRIGCIACRKLRFRVPQVIEIHHQNAGGHAGQKRLGDDFTIPLCGWHHRREPLAGRTVSYMALTFGPSLAGSSKAFRLEFGTDAELLAKANQLIGWNE